MPPWPWWTPSSTMSSSWMKYWLDCGRVWQNLPYYRWRTALAGAAEQPARTGRIQRRPESSYVLWGLFFDANTGVAVGLEGKVATTANAGQQWNFIGQAEGALFDTEPLYAPHLIGADGGGWIVGGAGRVLRLQGGAWQPTSVGMPIATWLRAVDFHDAAHGWIVGGYGAILRTTDGGQSWLRVFG